MDKNNDYDTYIERLNVQDVLSYAGYKFIRKDGLKYPCFQRIDSDGRRVRGDKFIVTQGGRCCFQPPTIHSFNVISLIRDHPELFPESAQGKTGASLVNAVCRKLLNMDPSERTSQEYQGSMHQQKPFDISEYTLRHFEKDDKQSQIAFLPYFKNRGIGLMTQCLFRDSFCLATHTLPNGKNITNLSFPLTIPGKEGTVGFEERSRVGLDGKSRYKGKAKGSNGSEGLWIASPNNVPLDKAKNVYWFESAYDAMAYFQKNIRNNYSLYKSIFVSTGGSLTVNQTKGMLSQTPNAEHHLCFDNDCAGKQFIQNWKSTAGTLPFAKDIKYSVDQPNEDYKDWNDELLGNKKRGGTVTITIATGEDLDGDGEEDLVEQSESIDDKKKQSYARHHL